jgi:hypothetical protein
MRRSDDQMGIWLFQRLVAERDMVVYTSADNAELGAGRAINAPAVKIAGVRIGPLEAIEVHVVPLAGSES